MDWNRFQVGIDYGDRDQFWVKMDWEDQAAMDQEGSGWDGLVHLTISCYSSLLYARASP